MPILRFGLPTAIDNVGIIAYEVWGGVDWWTGPRSDGKVILLMFQVDGGDKVLYMIGPSSFRNFGTRNPRLYQRCLDVGDDWRMYQAGRVRRFAP